MTTSDTLDDAIFVFDVHTDMSTNQVGECYVREGWHPQRCAWSEFKIACEWADIIIERHNSVTLMRGTITDFPNNVDQLIRPLFAAKIPFKAEFYSTPPQREVLLELRSRVKFV
jgi:hypothetical protein